MPLTELSFEFDKSINTLTEAKTDMTAEQQAAMDIVIGAGQQAEGLTDIILADDLNRKFDAAVNTVSAASLSKPQRSALDHVISIVNESRGTTPMTQRIL